MRCVSGCCVERSKVVEVSKSCERPRALLNDRKKAGRRTQEIAFSEGKTKSEIEELWSRVPNFEGKTHRL